MKRVRCLVRHADGTIAKQALMVEELDELPALVQAQRSELIQIVSWQEIGQLDNHLKPAELIRFFETVSTLIASGLNLQQSMDIVCVLQNDAKTERIALAIRRDIGKGQAFHAALGAAVPGLPPLVAGMIRIGEKIGHLEKVLDHLLAYLRLMQGMRDKIISAAMYPALILIMTVGGIIGLALFFIPQMEASFSGNSAFSATIRAGFGNLRLMMAIALVLVSIPIALLVVYRIARAKGHAVAARIERLVYRLPLAGSLAASSQLLTLSYALEVLTQSGVQLDDSLRLAAESGWSLAYRQALVLAAGDLKNGVPLSAALDRQGLFPRYFVRWVQIAEQTGKVAQVFSQLRLFYEKELEKKISRVMVMVEPLLIAIIGLVLMGVITTIVLPLFSMYTLGVP